MPPLVKAADRVKTIRDFLETHKQQLALALPKHMNVDRQVRIALTQVLKTPRLLECDVRTLGGAILEAAQLGVEPNGIEAHLVPFRNTRKNTTDCQLIVDFRGMMKLARQSDRVSTIEAHEVHQGDYFEYEFGTSSSLTHRPAMGDRGEVIAYYAIAALSGGGHQFHVLTKVECEAIRDQYSRAAGEGPWVTAFDEMAKKSCVRRLCKYLPQSPHEPHLARAVALDELAEQGIPQDLGDVLGETESASALNQLTQALKRPATESVAETSSERGDVEPPAQTSAAQEMAPAAAASAPAAAGVASLSASLDENTLRADIQAVYHRLGLNKPARARQREFLERTSAGVSLEAMTLEQLSAFLHSLERLEGRPQ